MFRSLLCKSGYINLSRKIINGDSSSSSAAKYFLFTTFQNQNVGISDSRVRSMFSSFSTTTRNSDSDSDFDVTSSSGCDSSLVVSYLINSCGLSENQAITASKNLNFKNTSQPDSVLTLLKVYGFTEPHISKLVKNDPSILSSNPHKTLKPKLDFFKSKGLQDTDLANIIVHTNLLRYSLRDCIIPSFDILRSVVLSDQNVIRMIRRNSWILGTNQVKRLMVNLELLRNEGVPQTNIVKYLIQQPREFCENANRFKETVEKVKDMGFNHLQTTFLVAVHGLASMREANWRNKVDVYKRWGWSQDQIQKAFRKHPICMMVSENKINALMNYLVNEMGYDSSVVAEYPVIVCYSVKGRIIPRCSVIRILVSKGLIKEMIPISTLSQLVDKSFLEKFVIKYEQQVPELMKIFQGQLNYQQLLQN